MATMQELIEQWKKEAAQSQTVTGPEIPNIAMYQAQNDVHRNYGAANSALAREVANQQMLSQPVVQMAPTGLDVTMQEKQDLVNARRAAQAIQNAPLDINIGSSLQMLPSMADYQSNAVSNRDGVLKYIADHPDEAEYVTRFLELNNGEMDGIKYKNYLKQQKDYELAQKWVDPNYKMTKEEEKYGEKLALDRYKVLSSKKNRTPEEDAELRTMDDLFMKTDEFSSFILNSADEAVKAVRGVKWLTDHGFMGPVQMLANKITDPISNKLLGAYDEVDKTPIQNAQVQNPIASGAGRFATNAALYSATNPAFDAIAEASGLTGAGKFALNQAAQFGQDVALDTIPTYVDMTKDGSLSDEEKKELAKGALLNAGGNLVLGGLGEAFKGANRADIPEVDKTVKEATEQAENAQKRIQELARQNEEVLPALGDMTKGAEDIPYTVTKAEPELPKMETPKAEIAENTQKTATKAEIEELNNELSNMWGDNAAKETKSAAKTQRLDLPEEVTEKGASDFAEIFDAVDSMRETAEATGNPKVIEKYEKLSKTIRDYEDAFFKVESEEELIKAKKAADAARQSFIREMKKVDPNYTGELTGTKLGNAAYRRTSMKAAEEANQELADSITEADNMLNTNRWAKDAAPETTSPYKAKEVPGANSLQTFSEPGTVGKADGQWKTSKSHKSYEKLGYGDAMPEKDYAYRVFTEAEQKAAAAERYADIEDATKELLNKDYGDFDEVDVKEAFGEMQRLMDQGDAAAARYANRLGKKTAAVRREGGRIVQAGAEYTRNTAAGAMEDALGVQENRVSNFLSRNKKIKEGNSRIAKALADMGHKPNNKIRPELSHDQIKKGVIAEIEREVGSVENHFNENDIEFLTQLAEDKSIPVWKITSEIEHKLKTGQWYSLDESVEIPKPTNANLQNALASLVNNEVRAPKEPKTLKQIAEEVKNTFAKESAGYESNFTDDEMDYIANLIHEGASKEELADALNTKMATGTFGVSPETMQKVNGIFKEIQNYDPDSKRFVEGQAEAYRLLANEVLGDATPLEKFEAWRYMAMLGNPKTMIRNFVGNQMFGLVTGISNNLAALGEAGVDKASKALGGNGIQRTKAILNPIADSNLIKSAAEDADLSKYRQVMGSKYEKFSSDTLRRNKSVFNTKLAQLYEKAVDAGISDYKAVKNKYSTSLAGYMKANGLDSSAFDASYKYQDLMNQSKSRLLSDAERSQMDSLKTVADKLEKGREYALKQAEYATFHEDNKIANVLSKWSRTSKEEGTGIGHVLIEGTVPFKKTPANVLRSGLEYSPLGAIDSIRKTGKLVYENTGKRAGNLADTYINRAGKEVQKTLANDVIESWSKTLTGTGLTALGFYLYDKGILNSSDKDTKYQDQLEGLQNYSITIGDKTYTVDWAAPAVMPLLLGAEIAKVWNSSGNEVENWYDHLDEYLNAANRIADPIIETSMLSGVKDTLETAANAAKYDENLNIPALAGYNMATGYLSQAVPTISGQIARTVDNTRRSTYTDKEGVAGTLEKQGRKMMNKIPGLSTLNQPYVDTYGREQKNGPKDNPLINFGYQAISPGYLQSINQTDADKMSREVYENDGTNNTGILPQWKSYFKEDGKRVSPEEYTTAAKAYGNAEYEIRDKFANDEWFKSLDDAEKTEIVKGINGIAEHVGAASIDPEYETSSKAYNAYKEGGIDGLIDYYKDEHNKDVAKGMANEAGVSTSTNAYKEAQALVAEGKEDEAQKVLDDKAKTDEILKKYDIKSTTNVGKAVAEAVSAGDITKAENIAKNGLTTSNKTTTTTTSTVSNDVQATDYKSTLKKYEVKDSKHAQAAYDEYGEAGVKAYQKIGRYGMERYNNAKTEGGSVPSLETFTTTYSRMDSFGTGEKKGDGTVNQDEFLAYVASKDLTEKQVQEYAQLYGDWKTIPVLQKDGTYKFKKKK